MATAIKVRASCLVPGGVGVEGGVWHCCGCAVLTAGLMDLQCGSTGRSQPGKFNLISISVQFYNKFNI